MVRAVRFAAEFDMRIAPHTWKALRKYSTLLEHVAMERIGTEADKMVARRSSRQCGCCGLLPAAY